MKNGIRIDLQSYISSIWFLIWGSGEYDHNFSTGDFLI
jgi:hypothetical protein